MYIILFSQPVYCDTIRNTKQNYLPEVNYNTDLVNTLYVSPSQNESNDVSVFYDDPGTGAVRINEYIGDSSGWIDADELNSKPYNTALKVTLSIIKKIPKIGTIVETIENIIIDIQLYIMLIKMVILKLQVDTI